MLHQFGQRSARASGHGGGHTLDESIVTEHGTVPSVVDRVVWGLWDAHKKQLRQSICEGKLSLLRRLNLAQFAAQSRETGCYAIFDLLAGSASGVQLLSDGFSNKRSRRRKPTLFGCPANLLGQFLGQSDCPLRHFASPFWARSWKNFVPDRAIPESARGDVEQFLSSSFYTSIQVYTFYRVSRGSIWQHVMPCLHPRISLNACSLLQFGSDDATTERT
jgi:hypothetical protein